MLDLTNDEWMNGWMDGWIDEWMNGWMDGWIDGWMDVWMDICKWKYVCQILKCFIDVGCIHSS